MPITSNLSLALPIRVSETEKPDPEKPGQTILETVPLIWAYHTPISTEVFEQNYRVFADAKDSLFGKGTNFALTSGIRIATLAFKDAARSDALTHEMADAGPSLLAELKRLTMILAPSDKGFDLVPVDIALAKQVITAEEWSECESVIVFFTCGYAMARPSKRESFGKSLALVLRGSMTSLSALEFVNSLVASIPAATSIPPTIS